MPTGRVGASTPRSRLTEGPCSSCSVHSVATLAEPTVPSSSGLGHHPLKVETRVRTPLGLRSSEVISGLRVSKWPRIGPAARTRPSWLVALSRLEHAVSFPPTVYPVERVLLTKVRVHPAWPPPGVVTLTLHA